METAEATSAAIPDTADAAPPAQETPKDGEQQNDPETAPGTPGEGGG